VQVDLAGPFIRGFMLSICTTVKNRSRINTERGMIYLFPNCLKSLAATLTLDSNVELVISDWESDDWPIMEWIEDAIPNIDIHLITVQANTFSAGKGRNIAAEHAMGDVLFFMDVDMIVNSGVIQHGIEQVQAGNIYYPTVVYEIDGGKRIIHEGGGNLFISKDLYKKSGGWPELYKHGFEDTDYAAELSKFGNIVTHNGLSLFHQWHPQTKLFKDAYAGEDKRVDERREFYQKQVNDQTNKLAQEIQYILSNDPNTTHSNLRPPVKAENRRFL